MCIQILVSFCQFVLKILSKNQILTSIKGRNSVANLRKTTIYYTKVDLVVDNVFTKFGLNRSIRFQDIEQKLNSDVNQGQLLCCICRNSNSSKLSCMSSIPARMKKIQLKMKALECSQDFSHYKSMGIFPDAQGQLTPQSGHNIIQQFFRRARADNSGVGVGIWPKFELIQAFMHVLVTWKNEDDWFKNEGARVFTRFLPL